MIIFSLFLILIISSFIHEMGHFLMAKYFRFDVQYVEIGFGPKLFRYKFLNVDWYIRYITFGGKVVSFVYEDNIIQNILTAFAGPFCSLLLSFIGYIIFQNNHQLFFYQIFYINFIIGILNLIPVKGNDGYMIIFHFFKMQENKITRFFNSNFAYIFILLLCFFSSYIIKGLLQWKIHLS